MSKPHIDVAIYATAERNIYAFMIDGKFIGNWSSQAIKRQLYVMGMPDWQIEKYFSEIER